MNQINIDNPYLPKPTRIEKITVENEGKDLKTFRLSFLDKQDAQSFRHSCGQFAMLSVPGVGESPIGIASSPLDEDYIEFTVKKYSTGVVTTALHDCEEGETIGVRAPFGNSFPMKDMEGQNIVIVGGGFAFTTLRATIRYILHETVRSKYDALTVVYGARSPGELLYKDELMAWEARPDVNMYVTVDKGDENWKGREGFVPEVVQQVAPSSQNASVLVCGPPIMLKFTMPPLIELGFDHDKIITSLERRMSCGVGKCGRCNIGSKYVCKDGPVFTFEQIKKLPDHVF
ncbi:MAG: FAD/NAD(P)-binding protein [Chitinispirillaceae bacterium]|nr:FAD/NAD(P)-binding protein [Chitinispirillaceae bacterium]